MFHWVCLSLTADSMLRVCEREDVHTPVSEIFSFAVECKNLWGWSKKFGQKNWGRTSECVFVCVAMSVFTLGLQVWNSTHTHTHTSFTPLQQSIFFLQIHFFFNFTSVCQKTLQLKIDAVLAAGGAVTVSLYLSVSVIEWDTLKIQINRMNPFFLLLLFFTCPRCSINPSNLFWFQG